MNKNKLLEAIERNYEVLENAPKKLLKNVEFMFDAAMINVNALKYADKELRDSAEFMADMVQISADVLQYATKRLKSDEWFMSGVTKINAKSFKYASEELRSDKKYILNMLGRGSETNSLLQYVSNQLLSDEEFMLETIWRAGGDTLQYASETLRSDKKFILRAITASAFAVQYASEELRTDEEIMLKAINKEAYTIQYATDEFLISHKDIVANNIQYFGKITYLPEKLLADKEFILDVVTKIPSVIQLASDDLKNDKEIMLKAIENNPKNLKHITNKEVALKVFDECGLKLSDVFFDFSEELLQDYEFVFSVCEQWCKKNQNDDFIIVDNKVVRVSADGRIIANDILGPAIENLIHNDLNKENGQQQAEKIKQTLSNCVNCFIQVDGQIDSEYENMTRNILEKLDAKVKSFNEADKQIDNYKKRLFGE